MANTSTNTALSRVANYYLYVMVSPGSDVLSSGPANGSIGPASETGAGPMGLTFVSVVLA